MGKIKNNVKIHKVATKTTFSFCEGTVAFVSVPVPHTSDNFLLVCEMTPGSLSRCVGVNPSNTGKGTG